MKHLKHLLLTNWHYFTHEFLDFGQINFLTGKTGSGKTTIIDAIQLLMLGDTTGHFFNKSASDKSTRSLKGYLRCEYGDGEDGNPIYLRNGRFTSYVAMEYFDDAINSSFVIGVVFDVFDDGSYDWKFFTYDGPIPSDHFIINNFPQHVKELNARLLDEYKNVKFFNSNIDYREFIKVRLGNLSASFFQLFKRAIPFSPISNIEQFITEYVCDVENTIDIDKMQESFRNYNKLEQEVNRLTKRAKVLEEICNKYNAWKELNDGILLKKYVIDRSELHLGTKEEEKLHRNIDDLKADIEESEDLLKSCEAQIAAENERKTRLLEEKFQNNSYKEQKTYEDKFNNLSEKIAQIQGKVKEVEHNILNYVDIWENTVVTFFKLNEVSDAIKNSGNELLNALKAIKDSVEFENVSTETLLNVYNCMNGFQTLIKNEQYALLTEDTNLNDQLTTINGEIKELEQGHKSYDYRLLDFKKAIEAGLRHHYNKEVKVDFLADLLDIKNESWRKSIETYLNTQRFYLVVAPEHVEVAFKVYDSIKKELPYFDYGIIDTEKVIANARHPLPNALSEEIITENKGAQAFINLLLGNLIKCKDVVELRKYNKSITKDGMLYQNFVVRALPISRTQSFLGSKASETLIQEKKQEIIGINARLNEISDIIEGFGKVTALEGFNNNEIRNIALVYEDSKVLPKLVKEAQDAKEIMDGLSDNYLESLNRNITACDNNIRDLEADRQKINTDIIKAKVEIEKIEKESLPQAKAKVSDIKVKITSEYKRDFIASQGEPYFLDLVKENPDIAKQLYLFKNEISETMSQLSNLWRSVTEQRTRYNTLYEMNYDSHKVTNEEYQSEYDDIVNIALQEYSGKIKEAKDNAMREFKNDFLSKLKSNFDTVISQISTLNDALTLVQFGEDSYKFSVTPRLEYKQYYDMINDPLLLTGTDIEGKEFLKKHRDTVEQLFREITFVDSETSADIRQELEKNVEKYTDYRSYLKFDLIVTTKDGRTQKLSRTLLHKSGGETQTPFYISILASFAQNYRMYLSGEKQDTIRLVVFDEAFSKMDSERIIESIKLLRQLGLQALVCCPSDKIQEITPLSDMTLCVVRKNTMSTVKEWSEIKK